MTKHAEGRFAGAAGGEIYWQAWVPETVTGVVLLSHGVSEHSGRYAHVATRLNRSSYAVYAVDHRGHGRSDGTPGNVDRFAFVRTDLAQLRRLATGEHPGVPVFLVGHSLGGLIALDYVASGSQEGLAGLVLSAAAIDQTVATRLEMMAAPILSRLAPNLALVALDSKAVSRDPAVVAAYESDPLNYLGKIRARTGAESLAAIARVVDRLGSLTLPTLVMHGTEDRLVATAGSKLVVDAIGSEDVTVKYYDGLFHEIFNEPEQDDVLDDVVAWLDAHA